MNSIIETKGITKYYGKLAAVDNVSLNVKEGEIYGFLGLNGAGKTTMIRMLLGMIKPSNGRGYINGGLVSASNYKLWKDVGYMVELPNSYPELTVYENLEVTRKLRDLKDSTYTKDIINKLALTDYIDKKAKDLSLGNRQRLGIAKALIHLPKVLILDEPTNGLDPAGIVEIRNLLKELVENRGVTILISSHLLGEISKTANRIGIIHEGKMIKEFNSNEFEKLRNKSLLIDTTDNILAYSVLKNYGYKITYIEESLCSLDERGIKYPEKVAELLVSKGCSPKKICIKSEDLEDYFLRIIDQKEL